MLRGCLEVGLLTDTGVRCKPGFIMQGSGDLVCILNSTWSPKFPVCRAGNGRHGRREDDDDDAAGLAALRGAAHPNPG
ncbi:hypothetical protein CRUP_035636 [Coryphaenoides rupestris]|nr:hypothetical protein CRUP_035636 [Coryphaenoides rupestris]